jgi:hypothetical protein
MDFIESSLRRLQGNVSRFLIPSAALGTQSALKAQIELRQRVLADIEVIRCRLRPFIRSKRLRRSRTNREQHGARSRVVNPRRPRS